MCLVIVATAFYVQPLRMMKISLPSEAYITMKDRGQKNPNIKSKLHDKYLVLSTCREDETVRSNLYLRQIPDSEMKKFLVEHGDQLNYVATRGQE